MQGIFEPSIGFDYAVAIVEFQHAAGNWVTLAPTVVATLPSTVSVGNMAFDKAGNLWLDEVDLTTVDGSTSIVEYTAASGYTETGTVIADSGGGGSVDTHCGVGASMAFTPGGRLEGLQAYHSKGSSNCLFSRAEFTPAGAPVTSIYYPNGSSGTDGTIAVDATGKLRVLAQPGRRSLNQTDPKTSRCTIPGEIDDVGDKGVVLQTIAAPASTNNEQQSQNPICDANGTLWFNNRSSYNSATCDAASVETVSIYELPAGATTAIEQAATNTASLGGPIDCHQALAITPRPAGLP